MELQAKIKWHLFSGHGVYVVKVSSSRTDDAGSILTYYFYQQFMVRAKSALSFHEVYMSLPFKISGLLVFSDY